MSNIASINKPEQQSISEFKVYTQKNIDQIPQFRRLPKELQFEIKVVANILPFRVNKYVIDELIYWEEACNDPIFILVFPQREMISRSFFRQMGDLIRGGANQAEIENLAKDLRQGLNPHPAGQMELNIPRLGAQQLPGMQHKYRETLLFFPSQGQVCHSFCTFCFRWAQFTGDKSLRFSCNEADKLYHYLSRHHEITDLLITGGDPMIMKSHHLKHYLERINDPALEHVQNLRIGTKALTYWPHRFVSDPDADDLIELLEKIVRSGKHVSLMAHLNHWRELEPPITKTAIERIRNAGVEIRSQGPILANINDDYTVWARMWREQVRLGIIPYYMFVERNTGARRYFEVPLARTWEVYRDAMKDVSGLARTARGPSMSTGPGKVEIQGITEINDKRLFVLRFIQGRNPDWIQRPFFAEFDPGATWLTDLRPPFGEDKFFFEDEYFRILEKNDALKLIRN